MSGRERGVRKVDRWCKGVETCIGGKGGDEIEVWRRQEERRDRDRKRQRGGKRRHEGSGVLRREGNLQSKTSYGYRGSTTKIRTERKG